MPPRANPAFAPPIRLPTVACILRLGVHAIGDKLQQALVVVSDSYL
jgi:hypothetical protein